MGKTSNGRANSRNDFADYSTNDEELITRETSTESSILSEPTLDEDGEKQTQN